MSVVELTIGDNAYPEETFKHVVWVNTDHVISVQLEWRNDCIVETMELVSKRVPGTFCDTVTRHTRGWQCSRVSAVELLKAMGAPHDEHGLIDAQRMAGRRW